MRKCVLPVAIVKCKSIVIKVMIWFNDYKYEIYLKLNEKNRTIWKEPDAQADFGPGIRDEGIQVYLLINTVKKAL